MPVERQRRRQRALRAARAAVAIGVASLVAASTAVPAAGLSAASAPAREGRGSKVADAVPGRLEPDDVAQLGTWHALPLDGATCGGPPPRQQYAYYLNIARDDPAGILFVLAGGGACLKDGPPPAGATGTAAQLHCMSYGNFRDPFFNDTTFATDLAPAAAIPFFRRGDAGNPFRQFHFVAVPYCTGDVHAGRMEEPHDYDPSPDGSFEVLHRGHLNFAAVVADVYARYPEDLPVVLTGMSAGGFGAVYNFPMVVARWPRTVLLPDAGMAPDVPGSLMVREAAAVAGRWGSRDLLPPYCRDDRCLSDTLHLLGAHARRYDGSDGRPWLPFGLLQGQQDGVLANYLEISRCTYEMGLRRGLSELSEVRNLRAFVPATDQHVFGAVNPLAPPFRSSLGVDPLAWFGQVATAQDAAGLPPDAVDPWLACNPAYMPLAGFLPRP